MSEDPWSGLDGGSSTGSGVAARRVPGIERHDLFWAMDGGGHPLLLLMTPPSVAAAPANHRMRGLEVQVLPSSDGKSQTKSILRLSDPGLQDVFQLLCEDVVRAVARTADSAQALSTFLSRIWRWHHLLRGGGAGLTAQEERGLFGELLVLKELIADSVGPLAAVSAWVGPLGEPKDFELGRRLLEIKTILGADRNLVEISSEHQLDVPPDRELYLIVQRLDRGAGVTLTELVADVTEALCAAHPEVKVLLEERLSAAGYDSEQVYAHRWEKGITEIYAVAPEFPKITVGDLPTGVSRVRYSISTTPLARFAVQPAAFRTTIGG